MAVSLALHVLIAAVLIFDLPLDMPEPETEQSVAVELVPPPEEVPEPPPDEKPEPPKEEAKAEAPKPPEAPAAPEEKPAEAAPPPPPAPPPPVEPEPKPEETPAAEEAPEQPEPPPVQPENPASKEAGQGQPLPVLRPVVEFGDKDAGPRKSETGNASSEAETVPDEPPKEPPEEPSPDTETAAAETLPADEAAADTPLSTQQPTVEPAETAEQEPAETDPAAGSRVPEDVEAPTVDFGGRDPQRDGPGSAVDDGKAGVLAAAKPPQADPSEVPVKAAPMEEVKTLFSQTESSDPVAMTAIGGLPRDLRAGQLCATELREQLIRATPRYQPEMLPSYRLPKGTVMDARKAAFRSGGAWYELRFRCEVDDKVTKVLSFAFEVGDPVPRSEWKARRFPAF